MKTLIRCLLCLVALSLSVSSHAQEEERAPVDEPEAPDAMPFVGSDEAHTPRSHWGRVFVARDVWDFSGSVDMASAGAYSAGLEGEYELEDGTTLRAFAAGGRGDIEKSTLGFQSYDVSLDWLQLLPIGQAGHLAFGVGGRFHGLGPDDDKLWSGYGGQDLVSLRIILESAARFWQDFELSVNWGVGALTFGDFTFNKKRASIQDSIELKVVGRLAYAPLAAAYAFDLTFMTDEGAYELEGNRLVKVRASQLATGATYRF